MLRNYLLSILTMAALSSYAQRSVPYFEDFSSEEDFNTYTIIDGYDDGCSWELNQSAADYYAWCRYNSNNPKDDWLISPAISLEAGKTYTLSFKSYAYNADWPEHLEVCLGQGTTAECMTQVVMPKQQLGNGMNTYYSYQLEVGESGDYNIGFHACSNRDMHMLTLDKVSLTEGGSEEKDWSESDIPSAVKNVTLREHDGLLTLSWEAPETGAHGGTLAPGLKYRVKDNHEMAPITLEGTGVVIEGYTFSKQTLTYFTVTPINDAGEGDAALSNYILLGGDYYTLPIMDTFDDGPRTSIYWNYIGYWHIFGYSGVLQGYQPYDGRGCLYTVPVSENEKSLFFSGNISLEGSISPAFDFYYYNVPTSDNVLEVLVSVETGDWQVVKSIGMSADKEEGWYRATADLSEFLGCRYLQVGIRSVPGSDCSPFLIDHFNLHDVLAMNLAVESLDVPALATAGTPFHARTLVQNVGAEKAEGYVLQLWRDGVLRQEVQGPAIEAGEQVVIEVTDVALASEVGEHSYTTCVLWDKDENNINNQSDPAWVMIEADTIYPVPQALAANFAPSDKSQVMLSWEAVPALSSIMVTETFEDYPAFTLTELGPWATYDADGQTTYFASSSKYPAGYPNAGGPIAWQILNLEKLGFDSSNSYFSTRSGNQILTAFITDNWRITADDWLFSPALSGEAHTLTFWTCSPVAELYGCDQFEVLGSMTGRNLEDFTMTLAPRQDAPAAWTQMSVEVPEGVKYFAIRHTAGDTFLMNLDDVSYNVTAPQFVGYNVYVDGALVNAEPVADITYGCELSHAEESHTVAVTAVYEGGESALSEELTIDANGIEMIGTERESEPVYDLYGRRIDARHAGIQIEASGKKRMMK